MTPWRFASLFLLAGLASCGGGFGDLDDTNDAQIRLVNATTEYTLDLYESDDSVENDVAPYTVSDYGGIDNGGNTLNLRSSGSSANLATATTTIADKDHQTVVAYTSGGALATAVLDDEEDDPDDNFAKLRIFNTAAADAGAVDVYLVSTTCQALATSPAAATATAVSGLQEAYVQVSASSTPYRVCVTATGDRADLRLDIPELTLSEGRIVTLILARTPGGFLLNGLALRQQEDLKTTRNNSARVRVAASVLPAAPLSVTVNGATVTSALASPGVGPYRLVAVDSAGTLAVVVNGVASPATLTATAGADLTLLLTGSSAAPAASLLTDDNTLSTSTARPVKLRLVNGLNGTAGTASLTVDNVPVGAGAAPGTASAYELLTASDAVARIEARDGATQLYLAVNATLTASRVYSLFLLGDVSAAPNTGFLVADR